MSFAMKRYRALGTVIVLTWAIVGLASGCSTASDPGTIAVFLEDFAREVLAAWLL